MRKFFKESIVNTKRTRTSLGRQPGGLRLDRNERVSAFPADAAAAMLARFTPWDLAAYPEVTELQAKLARFVGVAEDRIYIVGGVTEAIRILFETLCDRPHNVVALDPTYPMYSVLAQLAGVEYRKLAYDASFRPRLEDLAGLMDDKTAFVAFANPNLPIESALDLDEVARLADQCARNGSALVIDEAYHHFGAPSAIGLVANHPNLVVMRSFSKAFGLASIRVGFMVSSAENIAYLSQTRSLVESNTLSMGVACHALDHLDLLEDHIRECKEGVAYLHAALDRLGLRRHGGVVTNGMLVFLDSPAEAERLVRYMAERQIYIRGALPEPCHTCVRVTIGAVSAMRMFVDALETWLGERNPA